VLLYKLQYNTGSHYFFVTSANDFNCAVRVQHMVSIMYLQIGGMNKLQ